MSLFSATSKNGSIVHPHKVNIEGEIVGSFYSGKIEMSFQNVTNKLEEYKVLIGQSSSSNICLHDFKMLIDNNPFTLKIMKSEDSRQHYENYKDDNQQTVFGVGNDSYASIMIPYILPNQTLKISSEFELPISFPTKSTIEFFFPLTYPVDKSNDKVLECNDFHFICKFNSLPLKPNSVTSNPEGKMNPRDSNYIIDHLDPTISQISILYDLNPPIYSGDLNDARIPTNQTLFNDGIASCCGRYGSVTFIPKKDENMSHFGEDFIFIVDCSGSMSGTEIELAAECLIFFIKSLPENCFFNVVRFGSTFVPLFPKPVPYTDENAQKAIELAFSLEANLCGTVLSKPLESVFSTPLSRSNKLRRVFVLTDGCVFDPSEVINLVKQNSSTTMCNAIGIGYGVDRNLVKGIGKSGNGFIDFVLSGDDMRSIVIDQLDKSINGKCKVDISVEQNDNIEIVPPLSEKQLSSNEPVTFYFKSTKNISQNLHVLINIEGNRKPMILQMNHFQSSPRASKSLMCLFNNENLKYLRNLDQTNEIKNRITQLSIEYGILSPYTAFFGVQEYLSDKAKEQITKQIEKLKRQKEDEEKALFQHSGSMEIFVRTLEGRKIALNVEPNYTIGFIKKMIEMKYNTPNEQKLIFASHLLKDDLTLQDYSIQKDSTIQVAYRLLGGGSPLPSRTFYKVNDNGLVSIVAEQKVEGCWNKIPSFIEKSGDQQIKAAIQKVQQWAKNKRFQKYENNVVGTVISLFYMVKYKKEHHSIWDMIYKKALKWLNSINKTINWEAIIKVL